MWGAFTPKFLTSGYFVFIKIKINIYKYKLRSEKQVLVSLLLFMRYNTKLIILDLY
jgi:hypothetical protein